MSRPSIAIIGASANRAKFGNKCVRAYAAAGYDVFPVNPRETEIEGHQCWPTVADVPVAKLDRISVYLPPETCLQVLPELASKPAKEVWFNPGADDPEVLTKAKLLGLPVVIGCSIIAVGGDPHH